MSDCFPLEESVSRNIHDSEGKILGVMAGLLNQFLSGFGQIGEFQITEGNRREQVWLRLTARAFNSLRCAYIALETGYDQQAMMLIRAAWEDWLCCEDSKAHEETVSALLDGKGEVNMPSFQVMSSRLPEGSQAQWQEFMHDGERQLGVYGILSVSTHPRRFSVANSTDQSGNLRVGPAYDEDLYLLAANLFIDGAIRLLRVLHYLVRPVTPSWTSDAADVIKKGRKCISEINARLAAKEESS